MAEAAQQQAVELTLKTGEVIKAPNYEEALKIAVKMAEDTKDVYKTEKAAREQLEARMATIEAQTADAARPKPVEGQFSNEKYYELLNRDAAAANDYYLEHRFGMPANQLVQKFQQLDHDVSVTRQEAMAAQFIQQHAKDFPQTPDAAKALRTQFEGYLSQGYPATVETLNLAYGQAVNEGHIKPLEEKEPEKQEPPNPALGGGGSAGITDEEASKVETMSDKELEAYLRSKGLL